ncbi:Nucleotide-binding universal stress protein, UspA family [Mucilaginibacter gossypiicola]|uniref:Nucleotide-binding universal stress protein, UspA family n=1 Tax=Mucilaginibacter gossypiicola TaxID=551995 RepID=A0A1H8AIA0_9SPHI|nr:universal stress protein [Mucilaginibacter gossypiicola]SEM70351.1 Nucleotide-binding universal stress protein, UspA family [Mucilaginibacter gossypiicola]
MKTILVPTDFSAPAHNAASYALNLAKNIRTGVTLCHAIKVPSEAPMAAQVPWPLEDYASLKEEADQELKHLSVTLRHEVPFEKIASGHEFIGTHSATGEVTDVIRNTFEEQKCVMVVMGMSGEGAVSRFFLGSNTQEIINKSTFPVLLIPAEARFRPIFKIAFATDLSRGDIELIHSVASLAYYFNAELLITHITDDKFETGDDKQKVDEFLKEVTCKANYPKIYYKHIKSIDVMHGLDWLCEHGVIDMLVMVHRRLSPLGQLLGFSYTQKLSHHIEIPLLMLPEGLPAVHF